MIEPKKPKKAAPFPLQTGRAFKIYDKDPTPSASAVTPLAKMEKNSTEVPPRVARLLKLVDEEDDLEVGKPAKAASVPVTKALTPNEESEVEVIEVPLVRKRTLKKATDVAALKPYLLLR